MILVYCFYGAYIKVENLTTWQLSDFWIRLLQFISSEVFTDNRPDCTFLGCDTVQSCKLQWRTRGTCFLSLQFPWLGKWKIGARLNSIRYSSRFSFSRTFHKYHLQDKTWIILTLTIFSSAYPAFEILLSLVPFKTFTDINRKENSTIMSRTQRRVKFENCIVVYQRVEES